MTTQELKLFRADLNELASKKSSDTLSNDGPQKANAVMSTIFNHATNEIRIFANDMDGTISECVDCDNTFLNSLQTFLQRPGTRLKVIIEKKPDMQKQLFTFLKSKHDESKSTNELDRKVDFRIASPEFKTEIASARPKDQNSEVDNELIHFATGDPSLFRVEYDSKSHNATFSFNNEPVTTYLNKIFDSHFKECKPIE